MNLMDLFIKVGVDDQATSKIGKITGAVGKGLATAAKVGTAAIGAAAAGVAALTKASIDQYAEYEQLVGGVETLYGTEIKSIEEYAASVGKAVDEVGHEYEAMMNRQNTVMENAANAYQTAGLSANEYMETVNGFAASLTSSLGKYEWQAAEYADMIVTDMADNANKMGTSMDAIQNAYSGFAKQNYTMLDNLKIGYGGTKTEMERLLRDAEQYAGYIEGSLNIESFADVAEAIHIVQEEMGITGTTAKEASITIQGSVASAKSAWKNLVTGIADKNSDLDTLITQFVESVGTVAQNIIPKIGVALNGAAKLIRDLIPVIVQEIPKLISENLPALAEAAIRIVQSLVDGISENQEMLFDAIFDTIEYLTSSFLTMLPKIVELGLQLIVSLANGIAESLPTLIPTIVSVIIQIVETLTNPETLSQLLNAAIAIVVALANYLLQPETINSLVDAVVNIIVSIAQFLMENLEPLLNAAIQIILALVKYLLEPGSIAKLVEAAVQIVVTIAGALVGAVGELVKAAGELIAQLIETFMNADWGKIGKNIVEGFKNGIKNAWSGLKDWFNNLFSGLVEDAKNLLGIASPSKVFKKMGGFTAEGFGIGFEDEFADVKDDMENAMAFDDLEIGANIHRRGSYGSVGGGNSFGDVIINIDGAKYSDERSLAIAVAEALQDLTDRREAVYA